MGILKKPLKLFLIPAVNVLVAIFLLSVFFTIGRNTVQTFTVANMSALNYLKPYPIDYLWQLNIHQAPINRNKVRYYADYDEHLLKIFPRLGDAAGVLGYCYHSLNDDANAIKFFKIAIQNYPDYFWNYYDLGLIYINEARYEEASDILQKALKVDPLASFKSLLSSPMVYLPLIEGHEKMAMTEISWHLREAYQSCFILVGLLNQPEHRKEIPEIMKKFHPEIYAF